MFFAFTGRVRACALLGVAGVLVGCADHQGASNVSDLPDAAGVAVSTISSSQYPSVVKVIAPGGRGLCTGTFISPRAVLTAAHCTRPYANGTFTVVTSFGNFTTTTVEELGAGVVEDPNDIAILVFNRDVADESLGQVSRLGSQIQSGDTIRLVGFGCNDLSTRLGAGVKRTGTNSVYAVSDYIELITPLTTEGARGILGPVNRAGSCFGDSGGPMFREVAGQLEVVGVAHAGGQTSTYSISDYCDVNDSDNRNWIAQVGSSHSLGL